MGTVRRAHAEGLGREAAVRELRLPEDLDDGQPWVIVEPVPGGSPAEQGSVPPVPAIGAPPRLWERPPGQP